MKPAPGHIATRLLDALPFIGLSLAVAFACYPAVSAAWNAHLAHERFTYAASAYADADDPERNALLEEARSYNARMAGAAASESTLPYDKQLAYKDRPEIAWVEVPSVGIEEPVYRGTGDAELMAGAGHLEQSALPVGGESTRCVIAGHSGMRDHEMFDNLVNVEPGDLFIVWTLGEPLAYRVFDTRSVSPVEVEDVAPVPGRDLCTLVTCTSSDSFSGPAGILNEFTTRKNDLRLLVTGERCAWKPDLGTARPAIPVSPKNVIALGAIFIACAALPLAFARRMKRSSQSRDNIWKPKENAKALQRNRKETT